MKIIKVKIDNFRTLNGVEVELNKLSSYLIGENNPGKSNFLEALFIVFNGKRFEEQVGEV